MHIKIDCFLNGLQCSDQFLDDIFFIAFSPWNFEGILHGVIPMSIIVIINSCTISMEMERSAILCLILIVHSQDQLLSFCKGMILSARSV